MTADSGLVVPCAEPARRSMRFGPFACSRDALKFGAWAAVGTAGSVAAGPAVAVAFAAVGFGLAVARVGGRPIDAQVETYLRWRRRRRGSRRPAPFVLTNGPDAVAAVRADGLPVAFLPASAARELFGAYRELLRGLSCRSEIIAGLEPVGPASPLHPPAREGAEAETEAARGYSEMMRLLLSRRRRRSVLWVLRGPATDSGRAAVQREAESIVERLSALGLRAERLGRPELAGLLGARAGGGPRA